MGCAPTKRDQRDKPEGKRHSDRRKSSKKNKDDVRKSSKLKKSKDRKDEDADALAAEEAPQVKPTDSKTYSEKRAHSVKSEDRVAVAPPPPPPQEEPEIIDDSMFIEQ